jgi:hypothetical protein
MRYAIEQINLTIILGIETINTSRVEAIFCWCGAPLMMGVDSANRTEIMLRGSRVEPIFAKH